MPEDASYCGGGNFMISQQGHAPAKANLPVKPLLVRQAAVLGAGTMGSRIAAHLANAGIPTLLLFKNGEIQEQVVGATSKDHIGKLLDKHL